MRELVGPNKTNIQNTNKDRRALIRVVGLNFKFTDLTKYGLRKAVISDPILLASGRLGSTSQRPPTPTLCPNMSSLRDGPEVSDRLLVDCWPSHHDDLCRVDRHGGRAGPATDCVLGDGVVCRGRST